MYAEEHIFFIFYLVLSNFNTILADLPEENVMYNIMLFWVFIAIESCAHLRAYKQKRADRPINCMDSLCHAHLEIATFAFRLPYSKRITAHCLVNS